MSQFHEVLRPFQGDVEHLPGEAVEPDRWLHGRRLMEQRFIGMAPIASDPTACPCGRRWTGSVPVHPCKDVEEQVRRGPGRPPNPPKVA